MRILFAGGGTGGHLFPGIAIADEIRRRTDNAEITFVGTKDKIEARVVPKRGYSFAPIWISGFRRKLTISNLLFPVKVVVAVIQSFFLMKKLRPQVVVGTGGYVCGPPLFVASLLGIPTLIQEQNSIPGVTTTLLASRATEVHLTFESTRQSLKRQDNVKVSGNPTFVGSERMSRAEGVKFFGLNPEKRTILVFGGSLGATSVNNAIAEALPALRTLGVQIIWQTGDPDFERMQKRVAEVGADKQEPFVRVHKFIEEMRMAYSACTLAICRAGATTLAELTSLGVPAILVPYPFAAADHQRLNATMMVEQQAAAMIDDAKLGEQLLETIKGLAFDDRRLESMAHNAKTMGKSMAAATLADAVIALSRR